MSASDQTISFTASHKKLVNYVISSIFGVLIVGILFSTLLFILATNPNNETPTTMFLIWTTLIAVMWLYTVYEAFRAIMRAIHPDVIEVSTQQICVTDWKKSEACLWSELGTPEKKKIVNSRGGRVLFLIEIP